MVKEYISSDWYDLWGSIQVLSYFSRVWVATLQNIV